MENLHISEAFLADQDNAEGIAGIEAHLGRKLVPGETLQYTSDLCAGKTCPDGYKCVLGNCVKNDSPDEG